MFSAKRAVGVVPVQLWLVRAAAGSFVLEWVRETPGAHTPHTTRLHTHV